jgi:hypothetical protein
MKTTFSISEALNTAAVYFRAYGNLAPSHCDVRCLVNDLLDSRHRDGYRVCFRYSQDKAHRTVKRLIRAACLAGC